MNTDTDAKTIIEMYRAVIISIPIIIGLLSLVLFLGAAIGYVNVAKRIIIQAKSLKQSKSISNESLVDTENTRL